MKRLVPRSGSGWINALLVAVVLLVAGLQVANPHSYLSELVQRAGEVGSGPGAALTDLSSIDQLQVAFNRDAGEPRLVLLLSPT